MEVPHSAFSMPQFLGGLPRGRIVRFSVSLTLLIALAPLSAFANPKPVVPPPTHAAASHAVGTTSHSVVGGHLPTAVHAGAKSAPGAHSLTHSAAGNGTHSLAHYDATHPLARDLHPGEIYHPRFAPGHDPYVHPALYERYGHPIYGYRRYDAWAWNHGVAWAPVGTYWGGGFWGHVALGVPFGAAITIGVESPGYIVFQNYGLVQVPCVAGAGLAFIYGPSGSVICANPDAMVQAGNYNVDPATLELAPTAEE